MTETPPAIQPLTPDMEERIKRNPLLNIDTFIIPSPYIRDPQSVKDYDHSYAWVEEGEILGYLITYADEDGKSFQIYKLVTSPFGRGRGIGTAFIEHLARMIPEETTVYLYIWDKQADTAEFFRNKGFHSDQTIVYRNLVYHYLHAVRDNIVLRDSSTGAAFLPADEEIGRTRHDARKTLRLLGSMVDALAPENAGRIIEDINRETTTLVNMLNTYRDSMASAHEVNLRDLILERIVPFVATSPTPCELILRLDARRPVVLGYYLNYGRALVNLVSNALDAVAETGKKGTIEISVVEEGEGITLSIGDNGVGIAPELLEKDADGRPRFVGRTTKGDGKGEGTGTVQVFSVFGAGRISVESTLGVGSVWKISLDKTSQGLDRRFAALGRRYHELRGLHEDTPLSSDSPRTEVIASIWRLRKMEIFLFDLILRFSRSHNIRTLYRTVLSYLRGIVDDRVFREEAVAWRGEHPALNEWLIETAKDIRRRNDLLDRSVDLDKFRGALFKSYGQAIENVIIFTMDPETGNFLATDRKLAEHLDFVPYLGKPRDALLRGEFIGDMNNDGQPVYFGVWSVDSDDDLAEKLRLIRKGARTLLGIGIHPTKKLAFYQTTYVRHERDIDADASTTFGEMAGFDDESLAAFIRVADDEFQGYLSAVD